MAVFGKKEKLAPPSLALCLQNCWEAELLGSGAAGKYISTPVHRSQQVKEFLGELNLDALDLVTKEERET